jgi:hypothetical protein
MFDKTIKDTVLHAAAILLAAIIVSTMPTSGILAATQPGSGGESPASGEAATSPEIAEFMALLANPKIQKWLIEQHATEASKKTGGARRNGLGIFRFQCPRNPRAPRCARRCGSRSAEPVRASRRPRLGRPWR